MRVYTVTVELDEPAPATSRARHLSNGLRHVNPRIGTSSRGLLSLTVSLPAEHLTQAVFLATAAVERAAGRAPLTVAEVADGPGSDRLSIPDLVSVAEAAMRLGLTEDEVLGRIARHALPAFRFEGTYEIPRSAIESTLERQRRTGDVDA